MAEGFRFMPLGLVRLRTFRLSAWLTSVQHKHRCSRVRGADLSLRDVTIAQMGNGATECGWRHTPEARGEFWGFWKSQLSWVLPQKKTVDFRLFAEALRRVCTCWGGGRWKSQNRKNVHLSLYVEEPLNSKVIKGFVPELRCRQVFFVFRDSYVLGIYVMNSRCTFHIFMYGYGIW